MLFIDARMGANRHRNASFSNIVATTVLNSERPTA